MRILFICKKNEIYGVFQYCRRSSGLFNSTRFIVEGLKERGVHAAIVEVQDNNDIDREVTRFKPDVVVLEALWVVPEKFDVLMPLHPTVDWFVHLHSNMPFLAMEGMAMHWIIDCAARGVGFIANSEESYRALRAILTRDELVFLPNVYINEPNRPVMSDPDSPVLNIGCFGAVRPLKNQLLQALAAIQFAKEMRKDLRFHINATRVETGGAPVLKNLRQLFERIPNAWLIENHWNEPNQFLHLLRSIDIGMQVSLTETFNVVSADYVTAGLPIVVSKEVAWASRYNVALDNSTDDVVRVMHRVYRSAILVRLNQWLLSRNSRIAQNLWFEWTRDIT